MHLFGFINSKRLEYDPVVRLTLLKDCVRFGVVGAASPELQVRTLVIRIQIIIYVYGLDFWKSRY